MCNFVFINLFFCTDLFLLQSTNISMVEIFKKYFKVGEIYSKLSIIVALKTKPRISSINILI